ncbi:MAG: aminotransferase class I/II-fold pyridoxal phosphate-dependent enzyme [Alphaproteobacteria bacterium]|nr:aminotransferase class I/II-fold pyridoxal phosphate-dependent enzyme [Alphaproteobacteria bacterium]
MKKTRAGLSGKERTDILQRFRGRKRQDAAAAEHSAEDAPEFPRADDAFCRFDKFPGYERMLVPQVAAKRLGLANPFFKVHEGTAGATTQIDGRQFINFSSYNYLGLAGHPRVNKAAKDAIDRYGTSASASRLVAGERPIQRELEEELAAFYGVEDCVVFVSGHATNVTTIGYLFGPKDLVIHDALIHNSVLEGARLSGAARRSFPHNDFAALDKILAEIRGRFERVLIVIEGLYSMDGDIPDLPRFIDIKNRYKAFLMVDEAHSLGVLGRNGRGLGEHFGVEGAAVDIWMGTLSKTLAGCGGYICGESALVQHLKYASPGFVYSVGISPPLAAASLEALKILQEEPAMTAGLRARAKQFLRLAKECNLDTGLSAGYSVVPVLIGNSLKAAKISNQLFERGINVQPIIPPAVEERSARLRFFVTSQHTEGQIAATVDALKGLV